MTVGLHLHPWSDGANCLRHWPVDGRRFGVVVQVQTPY
jgi:hypothetical protein